jgi:PAS domain S-box-containing protein
MTSKSGSKKKAVRTRSGDAGDKDRIIAELKDRVAVLENELRLKQEDATSPGTAKRKRADEALQFERLQLLSIFDSIDEVIYVADPYTHEILYANKAMQDKFGKSLIGGICYREIQDKDAPCEFCTNDLILRNKGEPCRWEFHNPTVDRDFGIVDRIIQWPDGRDVRFEIALDITERKRVEEALRRSESDLKRAQAIGHMGSWEWDLASNMITGSSELYRMLGLTLEQATFFQQFIDRVVTEDRQRVMDALDATIKQNVPCVIDFQGILLDGTRRFIHVEAVTSYEHGKPVKVFGIAQDITERKLADEALQESEERFRATFEQAAVGMEYVSKDGRFLRVNQKFCDITGYSPEELVKLTIRDITYKPDVADEILLIERLLDGELTTFSREKRYVRKDGEIVWVNLTVTPIFKNGKLEYLVGVTEDISERKRAEKDLRLTQFSIDRVADIALWVAADGRFIYANLAACKAFGYTQEEFRSLTAFDTNPYFNEKNWGEHWKEVKERGSYTFEARLRKKDGTFFPGEITVNYLVFDGKEYNCSYIRDISERKRAEEALRSSEEKYRRVVETADEGIWIIDRGKKTTFVNDKMSRMLGHTMEEMLGKKIEEFTSDSDLSLLHSNLDRHLQGIKMRHDFRFRRKDGSHLWCIVSATPILDDKGDFAGGVAMITDITERKLAEEELKAAKAQADLYVDLMGHDINNMNQIAMGYLELAQGTLEYEGRLDQENSMLLSKPMETLRNASILIDNVRKLQREKAGQYALSSIDLDGLLQEVKGHYSSVPNRDVTIDYEPCVGCRVQANQLLRDVFVNLVGNAIKHSRLTRELIVSIRVEKVRDDGMDYCKVSVEDNGPGIPDEMKAKLFDRLSLDTTRARGKGFGLCLIKMLVDDYHGRFWVEDRIQGDYTKGARFVVMLPAVER